ncbi:MAG: hypothetical protein ACI4EN_06995 [Butyrivibrio sp.]
MRIKRILISVFVLLFIIILGIFISVPVVNDKTARYLVDELKSLPLPEGAVLLDSVSVAGKVSGNGNGMQFFGAILIESELTMDEIKAHYKQFSGNQFEYIVESQEQKEIRVIDRGCSFSYLNDKEDFRNYYIIYTWGSSDYPLSNLDLRGH